MNNTKNLILWALVSGLLGTITVSFIAPSIIGMLFTPPVQFGTNCEPAGNYAMMSLRKSQIIFFAIGAAFGAAAFLYLKKREHDSRKPTQITQND